MFFSNRTTHVSLDIKFNGSKILQVENTKFLSVQIDNNLSWKEHCQKVNVSTSRTLGILRKLKYVLPPKALLSIYNTFILPHLEYGILAWGKSSSINLSKLFIVQKRSLKIINHLNSKAHSAPLFTKCNTLPIFELYKYHLGIIMYKFNRNILPSTISSLFTKKSEIHCYNTRNPKNLYINLARTSKYKSTVRHQGPLFWNTLPSPLLLSTTVHNFKKLLKRYLLNNV